MNQFDDAADEAAKETDEELADKLATLEGVSEEVLEQLLPEGPDGDVVRKLIREVQAATNKNDRRRIARSILAGSSVAVAKIARKVILGGLG